MQAPLPPGAQSVRRAPLPTICLVVGATLCLLALGSALLRSITEHLTHDALVMRALGLTLAFSGAMIGRVAIVATAGMRQVAAFAVAFLPLALGVLLLAWPASAALVQDRGRGLLTPWFLAVPGILALLLSRWRTR